MYKKFFPIFGNQPAPFVYVDSASTSQRPQCVLDAMDDYYTQYNANPHRTLYAIGETASERYQAVRIKVTHFIHAADSSEIIFTKGATESINFVATAWGMKHINEGDEIVITELEHSSNAAPWYMLAKARNAQLIVIPINAQTGLINEKTACSYITKKTKIVALTHISNALGMTNNALHLLTTRARSVGACVLIDGVQAVGYQPINVQELDCDFYVFSGHKMLGPTGIGVLYMRKALHNVVEPYQFGGGGLIDFNPYDNGPTFASAPDCYEAGTPPIAQVIGLGAAIDFLQSIGMTTIDRYTNRLVNRFINGLKKITNITLLGDLDQLKKTSHAVSFIITNMHAHDVGAYLDALGICVRTGVHCAQMVAKKMNYTASIRVSFYIYNDEQDVDYILTCLARLCTDNA